uniref:FAD-binding domain-containing protein n=1 Tax=Kalanchoe fedtschenkoi TaxID=63787 RepID=A0A7N0TAE9_KALFE
MESGERRTLARDESFNFRAAYWPELHGLLYEALPENVVLWGHLVLSFTVSDGEYPVQVRARVLKTGDEIDVSADLLVAADGCLSSIRQSFLPDVKLRYSGYCAWRGVLDCSRNEESETYSGIRKAYPELGQCLYFDLGPKTHLVLYELTKRRINWIWYVNRPEPETKGSSVTTKVNDEAIQNMHKEADGTWLPEMARVMKETKEPFINVIYDCDPIERIVWNNVALVGDAAHPTTPHGLRSTNMSIVDAAVLGKCLAKWGSKKLQCALEEYQSIRVPVTSKQVLHSRRLGRIKQGLSLPDRESFDPRTASDESCLELQQKNLPFFIGAPLQSN